jgi:flagellar biosynthesis/type III secretory pathway chaperone
MTIAAENLHELIEELQDVLERERRALLSGTAEAIRTVTQHKTLVADLIDRVMLNPGTPRPDPALLRPLARYNQENGIICAAMLRHLTAAIDRLHQQDPHRSYNPDGSEQSRSARHALGAA